MDHPDNLSYNLETGVTITLGVIMNHISAGEIDDIIQTSKNSLKLFLLTIENFNLGVKFQ